AAIGGLLVLFITNPADEVNYFPLIPPLCVLAAIGISTMRRGLVSLIDWFAVIWFTFAAVLVWLGWTAATFGFPAKIAANFEKLSPGYVPELIGLELAVALVASYAWFRLIVWRTSSLSKALWRPMVLSSGGVVLIWLLMMTLWIPRIDYAKSFRPLGEAITERVIEHPNAGLANFCTTDYNLGFAQRATLQYHAKVNFVHKAPRTEAKGCTFLLLQDDLRLDLRTKDDFEAQAGDRWTLIWSGNRNSDRHEFFYLYARTGQ
ncbi:MAG TPA: glycosyltransferase, partial [Limnobacter sp.]|nr:glycosyltransferase [Limnobacter sp.]